MSSGKNCLLERFKGCLVGGVMGDCLGAPFEGERPTSTKVLNKYFEGLQADSKAERQPYKAYTDDTAMTFALCKSVLRKSCIDIPDLSAQYARDYRAEPRRGYGGAVSQMFRYCFDEEHLSKYKTEDEFLKPARMQFEGQGSFGNGAAMRVSPVALMHCNDELKDIIESASRQSTITHANGLAVLGSVVQAVAVRLALCSDSIEPEEFLAKLKDAMGQVDNVDEIHKKVYERKLDDVLRFLHKKSIDVEEFFEVLGNDISAPGSVPTAIYAFLKSLRPCQAIETDSIVVRSIFLSLSFGGDTDTIASMAASIAGAFEGYQAIPGDLMVHCEGVRQAEEFAEKFFEKFTNK